MTIDAFVAVLLDMLDTPEKVSVYIVVILYRIILICCVLCPNKQHTLVTEIRELVFPEDRTRYDEMVYRRDGYLTDRDRHHHRVSY